MKYFSHSLFFIGVCLFSLLAQASDPPTSASNEGKDPLEPVVAVKDPKFFLFRFQVGLGMSFLPAQGTIFLDKAIDRYQGGVQANLFFRVHQRWTLELSAGYLASPSKDLEGKALQEVVFSAGARIHLRRWPRMEPKSMFVMPYVVFGPRFSILMPRVESRLPPSSDEAQLRTAIYNLFTLGAYVGAGAEFRFGQHLALHADVRLGPDGVVDTENYKGPVYGSVRMFLQAGVGLTWYFQ